MEPLLVEELIYYKVLPFAIYGKEGELIFNEGETLNPEKISVLRKLPVIYKKLSIDNEIHKKDIVIDEKIHNNQHKEHQEQIKNKLQNKKIVEKFDFMRPLETPPHYFIDDIDIDNYSGPINKKSKIEVETQIKIKTVFINALELFQNGEMKDSLELFIEIKNKINEELKALANNIHRCSELLFLGEYIYCHMLNTAMLSTALASKVGYTEDKIGNVTLAALLHDIGKFYTNAQQKQQEHTKIGYNIVKNEFKLSNDIAKAILGHHENNDGSGYPQGLSSEQINITSNIINICSTFDNLIFNRTPIKITNNREALREMLNIGTNVFLPDLFYTFIHMFSYNDCTPLEEMIFG